MNAFVAVLMLSLCTLFSANHNATDRAPSNLFTSPYPSLGGLRINQSNGLFEKDIQVGCRELRAKRYISDGFCTSTKPIDEVVCAGTCLPIKNLPWYAEFVKVWASSKLKEYQCEEDVVRRKSVHLLCQNGKYRTYRIKVVKSCKCTKVANNDRNNRTDCKRKKGCKDRKQERGRKRKGQRKKNTRKKGEGEAKEVFEKGVVEKDVLEQEERGGGVRKKGDVEGEVMVDEVVDLSQTQHKQDSDAERQKKGRRKKDKRRKERRRNGNTNSESSSSATQDNGTDDAAPQGHRDPVLQGPTR